MWSKIEKKKVGLDDPVSFTEQVYLGCTRRAAQLHNRIVSKSKRQIPKTSQLGAMTWKVTVRSVLNAVANWRTRRLTNSRRFPHLVWTITIFWKKSGNCGGIVRISLSDGMKRLYLGHWITWSDQSQKGTERAICDKHVSSVTLGSKR